MMSLHVFLIVW